MNDPAPLPADRLLAHADFVRCMARAALHGDGDVDDVVQDTWLAALQSAPRKPASLRAWLGGIARRQAANRIRRQAATRRRDAAAAVRDRAPSAAEMAERVELGRRLVNAVLQVKEPYRRAVLLRYYDDLPPRRIAEQLGLPVETVRTHVKRGLHELRARLDQAYGDRPGGPRAALLLVLGAPSPHVLPPLLGTIGGAIMANKLVVGAVALLLFVGAALWLGRGETGVPGDSGTAAAPHSGTAIANADAALPPTLAGRPRPPAERAQVPATARPALRGQVVRADTGEGVPGALVYGAPLDDEHAAVAARSDADGRFSLVDLPDGDVSVFVRGAGWISDGYWEVESDGFDPTVVRLPGDGSPLTLRVVPCAVVEGQVLDPEGRPVPHARVEAIEVGVDRRPKDPDDPGVVWTDAQGSFRHDALVPYRACAFSARSPALPPAFSLPVRLQPGEGNPRVTIRLPAARRIRIRTVDAVSGDGVAGAEVWVSWVDAATDRQFQISATTAPDGFVEVGPVPRGAVRLDLRAAGYLQPPKATWLPEAREGVDRDEVEIRLDPGRSIQGRVVLPREVPIKGTVVNAEPMTEGNHASAEFPVEDDGHFEIRGLGPGAWRVRASQYLPPRWFVGEARAEAGETGIAIGLHASNGPFDDASGPAEEALADVDLVVLSPTGAPVKEGWVRFFADAGAGGVDLEEGPARIRVDRQGVGVWFEVSDLGRDDDGTSLAAGAYGPVLPVGGVLTLRLDPGCSVRGRVVREDGTGLAGVRVAASLLPYTHGAHLGDLDPLAAGHTDGDGAFALDGLREGTWVLALEVPSEYVPPGRLLARAGGPPVTVRLRRGASTRLCVLDDEGAPLPGARVTVEIPDDTSDPVWATTTDEGGCAALRRLALGDTYVLTVVPPPGPESVLLPHRDVHWRAAPSQIRLEAGVRTTGLVLDASGRPVAGAWVWWWEAGDPEPTATTTDEEGRFGVGPTRAGPIFLRARTRDAAGEVVGPPDRQGAASVPAGARDVVLPVGP